MNRRAVFAAGWLLLCLATVDLRAGNGSSARGLLAVRGDRVVASEDADRLVVPASLQKLVVAAAALHHLGPEHRISTELRAGGELRGATLAGDLILAAAADPTWGKRFFAEAPRAPLDALARQLADRGLRRIDGDLVIDVSMFPGRPFPTSRPVSELTYGYAAPTSSLAVDDNAVKVTIAPGPRIGAPATVRLESGQAAPRFVNHVRTVSRERHGSGTVDFLPVWESDTIVARGEYPISEPPYRIELSVPAPELHAARHLRRALERAGITVAGEIRLHSGPTLDGPVLARHRSATLAERLEPILTDSHNWHAEMLLLSLAAEVAGEGRLDEGLEIERRFLIEEVGCAEGSFHLDDASGLSPYNLISARAIVRLLGWVHRQPWRRSFMDALARNGSGTLEVWSALPPIAAKTGTVRHSLGLAGYLEPDSTEPVVFACILDRRLGERPPQRAEIASLLRAWRR
ncbi:MAG: D-alanyl-D-alanine carboxypeptidase/D-alanyl-D-alanine-endopeptidase [bacterium]|nr:D-alanyl-D-alanine carboxypeptidase/D-alanyl-D-alanine-endopeptidase [bacterium]